MACARRPFDSRRGPAIVLSALALCGCAPAIKEPAFPAVQATVEERLNLRVHWDRGGPEDEAVRQKVRELLARPLGAEAAVQIALLNNPRLQATYGDLGIAQAEVVQAGLLRNPVFDIFAGFPDRPPSAMNIEIAVAQDFVDILMRPARMRLAEMQFEGTRLRVTHEVFALAAEVRAAYYELVAARQTAAVLREAVEVAQVSFDLAGKFHDAGNISDLQLANEQAALEQARVDLARLEAQARAAHERLTTLMGLFGEDVSWQAPQQLADLPAGEPDLADVESLAIAQRLDLAAAGREYEALAQSLGLTRDWRLLTSAELGVTAKRETDRQITVGPGLRLELPFFDRRQAKIARAEAELRQGEKRLAALAVEIRSGVRAARDRMLSSRALLDRYREVLVPLRSRIVALNQAEQNYMLIGVFEVLAARQAEVTAYRDTIAAHRDYWLARADLERAVGGRLPGTAPNTPISPAPAAPAPAETTPEDGGPHHVESP